MSNWTHVLFKVIFLNANSQFVGWHSHYTGNILLHRSVKWQYSPKISRNKHSQTNTDMGTQSKSYHTLNDRQSVKTSVCLICLGIKTGRQLRNLRQQSIPQTICFHHLHEPNYYVQPAVSTERMNKFIWMLWTTWSARINFHAWICGYWFTDENDFLYHHWSNHKAKHMDTETFSIYDCLFLIFSFYPNKSLYFFY